MQLSDLQYLMGQLGPATADIQLVVQLTEDCWQVELDGGLSLQIGWQEQRGCMLFSCGLGSSTLVEREKIYPLLLNANLLLAGISGARLALSQPGEEVMLIGEYWMNLPSLDGLHQYLNEFLHLALKYAEQVVSPPTATPEGLISFAVPDTGPGLQRV